MIFISQKSNCAVDRVYRFLIPHELREEIFNKLKETFGEDVKFTMPVGIDVEVHLNADYSNPTTEQMFSIPTITPGRVDIFSESK